MTNLLNEFKTNLSDLEGAIRKRNIALIGNREIMALIDRDERNFSAVEIDSLIGLSRFITTYDPKTGVINEVIHSGNIELIRSSEVRTMISEWTGAVENLHNIEIGLSELVTNQYSPYLVNELTLRNSNVAILNSLLPATKERWINWHPDKNSKHTFNYTKLLDSPEFESFISQSTTWRIGAQLYAESLQRQLLEIIQVLEEELKT